jgi:formylglycine-generating enzyme required for sulfatase activity
MIRYFWFIICIVSISLSLGTVRAQETGILTINLPGKMEMKFRKIPAGKFTMGSPENEKEREPKEGPQHLVTITSPFYLGMYEVTQAQWKAVMGNNPSHFKGNDLPVESVSWNDVQSFIQKLNQQEKGNKYRLPTEAEWEYACRAGSNTRFSFGDDAAVLGQYAWYNKNSGKSPHPVGQKKPNAWGLYDMHGNVNEWCQSWSGQYPSGPVTDPTGYSSSSTKRVIRGGSWFNWPRTLRSAYRYADHTDFRLNRLGFRLARNF